MGGGPGLGLGAVALPNNRQAWNVYGLDQIWEMLRDEDGIDSFRQVTSWYRMAHLCTDQADQLEKALGQLMVKWPPNPGSAAQAFKLSVDDLILSMRDSAAAAKANEEPLIRITSLISDAKDAILELRQHRTANAKAESEWMEQNHFRFAPIPPSQFEPGWQEVLDRRARDIMFTTDQAIGQAAAAFRAPAPFAARATEPFESIDLKRPKFVPHPVFDPPAPKPVNDATSVPDALHALDASGSADSDVLLDGTPLPFPDQGSGLDHVGTVGPFIDTPSGRVLAPGGVIGAGTGAPSDGAHIEPASRGTSGNASVMPGMVAPPIGRGAPAHTGSTNATRTGGRRRRRSDPDDEWVPPAGGPAVLEARPDPDYFDPGPNVIGIDR